MNHLKYILISASIFLLASCGSKKSVIGSAGRNPILEKQPNLVDIVQAINAKRLSEPSIVAKINLNISTAKGSTRVGGSLKMKRDDVIQLSLVALGLMEVGKLELTPEYMMVIDRINHLYVKCSYQDIDFLGNTGIDFFTFQSLFWDELFVLNSNGNAPVSSNYKLRSDVDGVQLVNSQSRNVALTFLLNAANQLVEETRFSRAEAESPMLKWQYTEWTKLGDQDFPGSMRISFTLPKDKVEAVLKINSVKPDSTWETRTEINKNRYTEVSLQAAFNKIMSLAQ
ncbi:MAG: DUF4292 domain-containing protein [Bacteroidaceae bacterium]|jgi:hypothetical protein|nr:DUF4292 domain-containing protein [Bacteroidaceae bacterium]